jgi:hypothetical protein
MWRVDRKTCNYIVTVLKLKGSCLVEVNGVKAIAYLVTDKRLDKSHGGGRLRSARREASPLGYPTDRQNH